MICLIKEFIYIAANQVTFMVNTVAVNVTW